MSPLVQIEGVAFREIYDESFNYPNRGLDWRLRTYQRFDDFVASAELGRNWWHRRLSPMRFQGTITYRRKQVGSGFIYESLDDYRNLGVH